MSDARVPFEFPGMLAEAPGSRPELADAASQSLALLSVMPARIGAVLAGLAWRAIAGGPYAGNIVPAVALSGPEGCGKTTCGEVALSCLSLETGRRGGRRNAGSETATASLAADTLQARGRGLVLTEVPALGRSILTACGGGEAGPGAVDVLRVPIGPGEITADVHASLMRARDREGRAVLGAAFASWLAGKNDPALLTAETLSLAGRFAEEWRDEGHSPSTAGLLAELSTGWALMGDYLQDSGTYLLWDAWRLMGQARVALHQAGRADARARRESEGDAP